MLTIGCHLSSSKGYLAMGKEAVSIGANTFQFFTRNPRGSKAKAIDEADVAVFLSYSKEHGIERILAHAPYTLNPCSKDAHTREFAWMTMADDLKRMEYTPGNCYNFHPGSHTGQGAEEGIRLISEMLNEILKPEQTTTVLLETMSGSGSEIGGTFENTLLMVPFLVKPDSPVIQALLNAYNEATGEDAKPFTMGGGTYAREFKSGASFGPEKPWIKDPEWVGMMHGPDEGVSEDLLKQSFKIYALTLDKLMQLDLQ